MCQKSNFVKHAKSSASCAQEQRSSEASWKKLRHWYVVNCSVKGAGSVVDRMKGFPVLQFQSIIRTEQQQLMDKVFTMMHLVAHQHWCSKPKNRPPRGWEHNYSKQDFLLKSRTPGEIVDYEGPSVEFSMRIGVQDTTPVIFRNIGSKAQQHTLSDKVVKKASKKDIDAAYVRLHTNIRG